MISKPVQGSSAESVSQTSARQPLRIWKLSLYTATLLVVVILMAGCPPVATITVSNEKTQTGGYIHVSGQGFNPNSTVQITASNPPGRSAPYALGSVNTDSSGNFPDRAFNYTWSGACPLPGCAIGSNASVGVVIRAVDQQNKTSVANVDVINCCW